MSIKFFAQNDTHTKTDLRPIRNTKAHNKRVLHNIIPSNLIFLAYGNYFKKHSEKSSSWPNSPLTPAVCKVLETIELFL